MEESRGQNSKSLPGMFSLVIPVHNEALNIGGIITDAAAVLPQICGRFEIILVDDGSSDGTSKVAVDSLPKGAPGSVSVIRHETKMGYGVTVAEGLTRARGDYIAFIDGDGQFDVYDFLKLAVFLSEYDFVTGRRISREDNLKRKITSGVFNVLVKVVYRIPYADVDCALKVMNRSFFDDVMPIVARSALLNTELYFKGIRLHKKIRQVDIPHYARLRGVHSGGRLIPILRAIRDLFVLRIKLRKNFR